VGYYHGSKFALEGISSALAKEVKGFGVFVTALEPGSFRTDWAGRSMIRTERSISDYDALFDPIRANRQAKSGKQQGDPSKLGKAVLKLVESPNPPMHLLLGTDALQFVQAELKNLQDEITAWESVTKSTNFDQ
jgi:NAD(P)-dependent dehydrogenase (short-subunit alcohol dehydrogenase family)